jgi:hypothetical protein
LGNVSAHTNDIAVLAPKYKRCCKSDTLETYKNTSVIYASHLDVGDTRSAGVTWKGGLSAQIATFSTNFRVRTSKVQNTGLTKHKNN